MNNELQVTSTHLLCGQKHGDPACYLLPKGAHVLAVPGSEDMEWDNMYFPCRIGPEALETIEPHDMDKHGLGVVFASVIQVNELPAKMKFWGLNKSDILDILKNSKLTKEEILTASKGLE